MSRGTRHSNYQKKESSMNVNSFVLNITSDQPEKLVAFYRNVVQLPPNPQIGDEAFSVGGASFVVDGHSEISGPTKEPARALISFFVEDLAAEQERLETQGVTFIRTAGKEWWGGVISTFLDPDGNYCQIIEYQPDGGESPSPAG
jgi:predicted enzyme related to lactoylglutathione lyase